MEVPTLSANQVKGSLSKKSPLPMKSVRKALKSPYQTFWPVPKEDTEIRKILHRLLSPIQRKSARIPWAEFKNMSAEERSQLKNDLRLKNHKNNLRTQVLLGMNELMHGIERHSVSSAIISEDIQPTFLINMTLDLLATHHIPVIMLPKLQEIAKESLGFSCTSIGLKCMASEDNSSHFQPLHEKIVELANEVNIPKNQTLIQCPKDGSVEQVNLPNSSRPEDLAKLYSNGKVNKTEHNIQKDSQSSNVDWKSRKGQLRNRKHRKHKRDVCKDKDKNVTTNEPVNVVSSEVFKNGKGTAVALSKGNKQALPVDAVHESVMDTDIGSGEAALGVESQAVAERESSVPVKVGELTSAFVRGTRFTCKSSKFNSIEAYPYLRTFENRHLRYLKLYKQRYVSHHGRLLPRNARGKYAKAGKQKLCNGNTQKMDESGDNGHCDNKAASEDVIMINDKQKEEEFSLGCYRQVNVRETIAKPKDSKKVKTKKKKPGMPAKK